MPCLAGLLINVVLYIEVGTTYSGHIVKVFEENPKRRVFLLRGFRISMDSIPRALDVGRSADMGKGPDIRIFPHIFPHICVGILMLSLTKKNSKRRV